MPSAHDQPSGSFAETSEIQAAIPGGGIVPLSDVLRTVKLKGALLFLVDATDLRCVDIPGAATWRPSRRTAPAGWRACGTRRSDRRWARCVGETPMGYLKLWRMQLAARQLDDSRSKVAAIAEEVGFRSEGAFSRSFKQVTGHSPVGWRRRHAD